MIGLVRRKSACLGRPCTALWRFNVLRLLLSILLLLLLAVILLILSLDIRFFLLYRLVLKIIFFLLLVVVAVSKRITLSALPVVIVESWSHSLVDLASRAWVPDACISHLFLYIWLLIRFFLGLGREFCFMKMILLLRWAHSKVDLSLVFCCLFDRNQMVDRDEDEHDKPSHDLTMLELDVESTFIKVWHERVTNGRQSFVGLLWNAANVRAEDTLLDLLDFKANLLAVRRIEQKVSHRLPLLKRQSVPLLAWRSERIHEAAENVDSIDIALCWLAN